MFLFRKKSIKKFVDDLRERRHQCFFFEKSRSKKLSTTCGKVVINVFLIGGVHKVGFQKVDQKVGLSESIKKCRDAQGDQNVEGV